MHISFDDIDLLWREKAHRREVYDTCRKRWVSLTPEEWVRQHFLQFLLQKMAYPSTLIAIEKELVIAGMRRRFDLLVYDPMHQPWMMIECKAQEVSLGQSVLDQLLHYNMGIPVPYLVITNGNHTFGFERTEKGLGSLSALPDWK